MGPSAKQKEEERYYLEIFLDLHGGLAVEDLRNFEGPDFLGRVNGEEIGIEVTKFFFPSSGPVPPQAVSRYREEFRQRLVAAHLASNLPALTISLNLAQDQALVTKAGRDRLEAALFDFVRANIPPEGPHLVHDYRHLPAQLRELGVHVIMILRNEKLTRPFWSIGEAAFVPESDSRIVQAIIDQKELRAAAYRAHAAALWLLIVSGVSGIYSVIDFDRDVLTATYPTSFDRVFLLRTFGSSARELKVRPRGLTGGPAASG